MQRDDMKAESKHMLRKELLQQRNALDNREWFSQAICNVVTRLAAYRNAQIIHCYLPIGSEVNTHPLIMDALMCGKRVVVPIVQSHSHHLAHSWLSSLAEEHLNRGIFGTLQPNVLDVVTPGAWDLTFVPLLGFDRCGYRLGYGKGYYDRLLACLATPSIGLAFAMQEVERLPHDEHDVSLNWIVTEREIIACQERERLVIDSPSPLIPTH